MAAVVVALVLLVVLLSTGRVMSAQGDDKPVPPEGTSSDPSPYVDIAPTDEELLDAPPSIERYVSAHSLPAGTLLPADLTQSTAVASSSEASARAGSGERFHTTRSRPADRSARAIALPIRPTPRIPTVVIRPSTSPGLVQTPLDRGHDPLDRRDRQVLEGRR